MAAEASVALMHRITNVRLPGPLPGDGDQRYAVCLDSQGLICRIEAMGTEDQQTDRPVVQEASGCLSKDEIRCNQLSTRESYHKERRQRW